MAGWKLSLDADAGHAFCRDVAEQWADATDPAFNRRFRIDDDVVERSEWTKQNLVEELA